MKTKEEINKIFAEFMGEESILNSRGEWRCQHSLGNNLWLPDSCLLYDSSWSWLMPVVEKILTLFGGDMNMYTANNGCRIYSDSPLYKGELILLNTTRESTYQAVFQFIEWYNQQEKK